ncbi:glycosyl transferase family 2 [Mucilaginibacter sp. PPCGB 2223]|uniref:glycosyltransferase n=1 Tax=Mucilaginibacter sp. PPCGB 2223 TaxID=1886027 RepID=UPI000826A54B|nr:glycosyltransferase family 2 protein [Mucilaginibacter sp. PPCGB 2223]OCX51304.1 glycosyl transferase family 2 [Mucilaginibacter sp. PPCGB 2223]
MSYIISFVLFFMIVRFCVTLFNFISDPKLRRVSKHAGALVSILIPVRNEEHNILPLLRSITSQDYQDYEVIILDDASTDETFMVCSDFASRDPRFKVMKGAELPPDWLGKNYACHQLARQARGGYLLFLDADEKISNGLINSAVYRMQMNNLSLLSLFTNQTMLTLGENIVIPLMHFILLNLLPLKLVFLSKNKSVAAASGQFMLFNAADYHHHNWHRQVKEAVVEDVEIMKQVKSRGLNGEALLANGMISCRMYTGFGESIAGFSKNFLAAFNYSVVGLLVFLLLIIGGPLIIISTLNFNLVLFMCGLIVLNRVMISLLSGQRVLTNAVLHPLQMCALTVIAFLSIQKYLTKTNVWKGRRV